MKAVRIHHVAFRTRDLPRLEAFYCGLLGLAPTRRSEGSIWLAAGDAHLMLERRDEGEPDVPEGTREIVVFAIGPEERALYTRKLEEAGVPVEAETGFTVYFRDPDGRRVGLSHHPAPRLA